MLNRKSQPLRSLADQLDSVIRKSTGADQCTTELQVRIFSSGEVGHPKHQDLETIEAISDDGKTCTTWISTSLLLSSPNPGPEFLMHLSSGTVAGPGREPSHVRSTSAAHHAVPEI